MTENNKTITAVFVFAWIFIFGLLADTMLIREQQMEVEEKLIKFKKEICSQLEGISKQAGQDKVEITDRIIKLEQKKWHR